MIKETGSRYFDSAYFVLRCDLPTACRESDMLAEARRMIAAYDAQTEIPDNTQKKRAHGLVPWLIVASLSVLFAGAALITLILL